MQDHEKKKVVDKYPEKKGDKNACPWDIPEKRLRFVDFRRIEDNRYQQELSSYELQVKEKLACVPSPMEQMILDEDEERRERLEKTQRAKMAHLVRKANLSPQQLECYRLLYLDRFAEKKVRRILGISQSHLCHLKQSIEEALMNAHKRGRRRRGPRRKKGTRKLTARQSQVHSLRFRDHLSLERIAARLGISKQSVHEILKGVQKKYL